MAGPARINLAYIMRIWLVAGWSSFWRTNNSPVRAVANNLSNCQDLIQHHGPARKHDTFQHIFSAVLERSLRRLLSWTRQGFASAVRLSLGSQLDCEYLHLLVAVFEVSKRKSCSTLPSSSILQYSIASWEHIAVCRLWGCTSPEFSILLLPKKCNFFHPLVRSATIWRTHSRCLNWPFPARLFVERLQTANTSFRAEYRPKGSWFRQQFS